MHKEGAFVAYWMTGAEEPKSKALRYGLVEGALSHWYYWFPGEYGFFLLLLARKTYRPRDFGERRRRARHATGL